MKPKNDVSPGYLTALPFNVYDSRHRCSLFDLSNDFYYRFHGKTATLMYLFVPTLPCERTLPSFHFTYDGFSRNVQNLKALNNINTF